MWPTCCGLLHRTCRLHSNHDVLTTPKKTQPQLCMWPCPTAWGGISAILKFRPGGLCTWQGRQTKNLLVSLSCCAPAALCGCSKDSGFFVCVCVLGGGHLSGRWLSPASCGLKQPH